MAESNNIINPQTSVTAIWRAFVALRHIGSQVEGAGMHVKSAGHPADYIAETTLSMLPAMLALPARSDEEAMMQLCALAELVTVQADSESGKLNEPINLWRSALVSILNAYSGDECLSRCLNGMEIADFLGSVALDDVRNRLARIEGGQAQ